MRKTISTDRAPKAIGPYSQAIAFDNLVFVSGQISTASQDIRELTHQVIDQLEQILIEAGSSLDQVLKVDIFLRDLKNDFGPMNEEYAKRFKTAPARQTVEVSKLPLDSRIEMSCIAVKGER